MLHWSIEKIQLNLKYTWKISRNATDTKTNLIVTVTDGVHSGKGEAAPNVRYNESAEAGLIEFKKFTALLPDSIPRIENIHEAIKSGGVSHSLSFAIESAYLHYLAASRHEHIGNILEIPSPETINTSYTIPIMETGVLKKFYADHNLQRFPFIKLKVNADDAFESLRHLLTFCNQPVMVDANEAFTDVEKCIYWLEKIRSFPLVFVEQPMPSHMTDESAYMKKYSPFPLFADEAVTDQVDIEQIKKSFDGINMKLMKAGGYLNGIRILKEARKHNLRTMIGCMVETTLGISSAMNLCALTDYADLDSFLLVNDEPYGLINEEKGQLFFKNNSPKS